MLSQVFALLVIVVIVTHCAPLDNKSPEVVRYEYEHLPDNAYRYVYELSDGQFKDEYGTFIDVGDQKVLAVSGSYGYIDADGKEIRVSYTSDEKGYRASGVHIPDTGTGVPPPPPSFISPSLIATLTG